MLPPMKRKGQVDGVDKDEEENDQYAVHSACHEGNVDKLRKAMDSDPNFKTFDDSGRTPLYYSASGNEPECTKLLCERRSDLLNIGDVEGDRPLHIAAYYGHTEVLEILLQYGADVNTRNRKNATPLHCCSSVECCKLLMDYGADLYALDEKGRVPLFSACASDKCRIVTEILNNPKHDASAMLKIQDSFGDTALHACASNGSIECIKAIKGFIDLALIQVTNQQGYTADDLAGYNHRVDCMHYIRELQGTLFNKQLQQQQQSYYSGLSSWGTHGSLFAAGVGVDQGGGFYGMMDRPQSAAVGQHSSYSMQDFGQSAQQQGFQGNFRRGTEYFSLARPQTASYQVNDYSHLPPLESMHTEQDVWNVFSNPWEDGYQQQQQQPSHHHQHHHHHQQQQQQHGYFDGQDDDRANTPWSKKRQGATMEDWRGEWAQFVDENGNTFWWNSISGISQYEEPKFETAEGDSNQEQGYITEAEQIRQRSFVLDRIGDWSECQDPVTGDVFFYNNISGECEWEAPIEVEEERARLRAEEAERVAKQAEEDAAALLLQLKQEKTTDPILKDTDWRMRIDEASNSKYYINKETGETSWTEPEQVREAREAFEQKERAEELDALKKRLQEEAAAQIAEQVKAVISSTEEERMRLRQEFDEKMRKTEEQTKKLAEKLEEEEDAARRKKQEEIMKLRDKEMLMEEKNKRSEEKAELLAEHSEEIKQLASVLSADRMRQNEKLQEKLQERRRARALKRAQLMNQAKEKKEALTPSAARKSFTNTPKSIPGALLSTKSGANVSVSMAPPSTTMLGNEGEQIMRQAIKQTQQIRLFVGVHLQYMEKELTALMKQDHGSIIVPILWAVFRTFALQNKRSALARTMDHDNFKTFLEMSKLKLSIQDRETVLKNLFANPIMDFPRFLNDGLLKVVNTMGCGLETFYKEAIVPICVKESLVLEKRAKFYQEESKLLATDQVKKILQLNVAQLKIVYIYYCLVAKKRKSPVPDKTISIEELVLFAKDFKICPTLCSIRQFLQLYADMYMRKPGPPSSLENYAIPFNQWVQLLFHASLRYFQENKDGQHKIVQLLQYLDQSNAKAKIKAKGIQPFTTPIEFQQ